MHKNCFISCFIQARNLHGQLPLCQDHYRQMYKTLNPSQFMFNCKTCNKRLKSVHNCRKCPNVQLIQKILNETTDFDSIISSGDQFCYACYKAQLMLIKQVEDPQTSNDDDLKLLISNVKSGILSSTNQRFFQLITLQYLTSTLSTRTVKVCESTTLNGLMICGTGYGGKLSMRKKWFHQVELYSDTGRDHAGLLTCGNRQTRIK